MDTSDDIRPLRARRDVDVIVVGARAAGAATAMLLARRGLDVVLLERAAAGSDTMSTHALMRGGVLQLSRWGLLDAIVAAGTPPVTRTTFRYGREQVVIDVKPSPGVEALYAPRRTVLDPLLAGAAEAAGAQLHHRTAVTDVVRGTGGRIAGVRAATAGHDAVELRAPLVIGADGVRSTIARLVDARERRVAQHTTAVSYGYWSDVRTDGYEWVFRSGACSGVIPTNDGQACVFASAPAARIGRGGVRLVEEVVAAGAPDVAQRLAAATPPNGTRTWGGHHGFLRASHGPGWALVGDAGYFKDPISAHGLTDALRDAELLARAVSGAFGDDHALQEALAGYEADRDRLSIPLFDVVDRVASQRWDDAEIAALLLELSASMADELATLSALDREAVG